MGKKIFMIFFSLCFSCLCTEGRTLYRLMSLCFFDLIKDHTAKVIATLYRGPQPICTNRKKKMSHFMYLSTSVISTYMTSLCTLAYVLKGERYCDLSHILISSLKVPTLQRLSQLIKGCKSRLILRSG